MCCTFVGKNYLRDRHGLHVILTICYIAGICYLSSLPGGTIKLEPATLRKLLMNLLHIPLYGGLTILLSFFFSQGERTNANFSRSLWYILIIAISIALLDEINQSFIPGRTASLLDIFLDGAGIISALWIIYKSENKKSYSFIAVIINSRRF